ncbi:MAG: isoprenyl transferase [Calditrichaeota bacterium]|nr:isoprenyl transferase [Calditrichota bacterium]
MKSALEKQIQSLRQTGNLPQHVAVIMDGNGRWAKSKGKARAFGHNEGVNSVRDILEVSIDLGIEYLTLYTFSTENWNRPKYEVNALMKLLVFTLEKEIKNLVEKNVRVQVIGHINDLPGKVATSMKNAIERTKFNTGLTLNIALSYSSRIEIVDAVRKIAEQVKEGHLLVSEINEDLFSASLYTANIPDPDLLIRTSGEFRISNFLLWQLAYTELYITDTLWPEFRQAEFLQAVESYTKRERRFGKVSEQINK